MTLTKLFVCLDVVVAQGTHGPEAKAKAEAAAEKQKAKRKEKRAQKRRGLRTTVVSRAQRRVDGDCRTEGPPDFSHP